VNFFHSKWAWGRGKNGNICQKTKAEFVVNLKFILRLKHITKTEETTVEETGPV